MAEKKKMGRPKLEEPKVNGVRVRFSDKEFESVRECAERHNMTVTEFVRKGAVDLADSWE